MKRPHSSAYLAAILLTLAAVLAATTCTQPMAEDFVQKVKQDVAAAVALPRALSISGDGNGIVENQGEVVVKDGIAFSVSATPFSSHVFGEWTKVSGKGTVVFEDATAANTTVTVTGGDAEIRAGFEARPKVYYATPTGNGIYTNTPITIYFSKEMDEASVESAGAVQILKSGSEPIEATVQLIDATTARVVPSTYLRPQCYYVIQVAKSVMDAGNHEMETDYSGNFKTASTSDTIAPTSPAFAINSTNPPVVASRSVTLTGVSAVDEGEVVEIRISENGGDPVSVAFADTIDYTLTTAGDGDKVLTIYAVDSVGNVDSGESASHTVKLDTTAPSGSFSVVASADAMAGYVRDSTLTLSCSINDTGTAMAGAQYCWSMDSGTSWTSWSAYAATTPGVDFLAKNPGQGGKTVMLKVRDSVGNSASFEESFVYDSEAPAFTAFALGGGAGYATTDSVPMAIPASDGLSGLWQMSLSDDGVWDTETWEAYAASDAWAFAIDGNQTIHARVRDRAGNISTDSDAIIVDRGFPAIGSILIEADAPYATTEAVGLSLSASDQAGPGGAIGTPVAANMKMRFSNDGVTWGGWENYATARADWNLVSGDGGKTVWVQVMDVAGNVSELLEGDCDGIILDTSPPTVTAFTVNGTGDGTNAYVKSSTTTVSMTVPDSVGSPVSVRFTNDGGSTWTGWTGWQSTIAVNIGSGDGTKTMGYEIKDACYPATVRTGTDTIILDTSTSSTAEFQVRTQPNPTYVAGTQVLNTTTPPADTWKVEYLVGGSVVATDTASPFSFTWATTGYTNGTSCSIIARSWDRAGNTADATFTRIVDNALPTSATLAIDYAGTNASYVKGTRSMTAAVADAIGIGKVEYYVAGILKATSTTGPNYAASWDTSTYTSGTAYAVACKAYDYAGNNITSSALVRTVDNVAPTSASFAIDYAGTDPTWLRSSRTVTATVADAVGIGKVELYIGGTLYGSPDTAAPYSFTWNTATGFATGSSYAVYCKAYDHAGNVLDSASSSFTVDNSAPTVTLNTAFLAGPAVSLAATATDGHSGMVQVSFSGGGTSYGTDTNVADSAFLAPTAWDVTALTEASTLLCQATAVDKAGNSVTSSAYLEVDNYDVEVCATLNDGGTAASIYGSVSSIATNDYNTLYIAYYDATNKDVDLLKSTDSGSSWAWVSSIDYSASGAVSGSLPALTVDASGYLHAAWITTGGEVYYSKSTNSGVSWSKVALAASGAYTSYSPVIETYGTGGTQLVHVAWICYTTTPSTSYSVKYCCSTNGGTSFVAKPDLVASTSGQLRNLSSSITTSSSTASHFFIACHDYTNRTLIAASTLASSGAVTYTGHVVGPADVGMYPSVAAVRYKYSLNYYEKALVTCGDGASGSNLFAFMSADSGSTFSNVTIATPQSFVQSAAAGTVLGLSPYEHPLWHSAYYNYGTTDLWMARSDDGTTWQRYPVDISSNTVGQAPSVVSDGTYVYISYYDATAYKLKFARYLENY